MSKHCQTRKSQLRTVLTVECQLFGLCCSCLGWIKHVVVVVVLHLLQNIGGGQANVLCRIMLHNAACG